MAEIRVYPYKSPRIIEVLDPATEIDIQELHNLVRDWEDGEEGHTFDVLIDSAGKEPLGGGVFVGITSTLQNAYVMFTGRTAPLETGTCTTGDSDGTTLHATGGGFVSNGVAVGDTVMNYTTKALANVVNVVSDIELETLQLSGGSRATWVASDEYIVWNNQQCDLSGGNLVAVDSGGSDMSPVLPSPNVQIVRTSSSSATLQELGAIQYASYNGGVTVDETSSYSGTDFPTGTPQEPVNNLTDAMSIATDRGFTTIYIIGDMTIDSGGDYSGMTFIGESMSKSTLTISAGANVTNCEFYEATVDGTLDGNAKLKNCRLLGLDYIYGVVEQCMIGPGTIVLGGTEEAHFLDCWSGVAGLGTPVIDCGGAGQDLALRNYNGGVKLINKTGADKISIDLNSGQVVLDSTVTGGEIVIRGIGHLTDDSTGTVTVNYEDLINNELITNTTWDTVHIDTDNGTDSTVFPSGTPGHPCKTISNARTIADARGIESFHIHGSITLHESFANSYTFRAHSPATGVIDLNNQNVEGAFFHHVALTGVQNGRVHAHGCELISVTNMEGEYLDCVINSNLDCKTGEWTYLWGGQATGATMYTIDMNGGAMVGITKTTLVCKVQNMTDPGAIFLKHGQGAVGVDNTNTAGSIRVGGEADVIDMGAAGVSIFDDTTREVVWDSVLANHLTAGTTGKKLYDGGTGDPAEIAAAVWDADKDDYNDPDTMGELQNTGGSGGGLDADAVASAVWDAIANQYGTPGTMGWLQNLIQAGLISSPRIIPGD
jgi:hypothetical protein